MPLPEEHFLAAGGMVNGPGIFKGAVPAQLLEPAHIVQQAGQPGQVGVRFGQGKAAGDLLAQSGHPIGVFNFQAHLGVGGVVSPGIISKSAAGAVTVQDHEGTSFPE